MFHLKIFVLLVFAVEGNRKNEKERERGKRAKERKRERERRRRQQPNKKSYICQFSVAWPINLIYWLYNVHSL